MKLFIGLLERVNFLIFLSYSLLIDLILLLEMLKLFLIGSLLLWLKDLSGEFQKASGKS